MKVLVTGATGFLGKHTCQTLAKQGSEVTATGRNLNLARAIEGPGIRFVAMDLSQPENLIEVVKGHDAIIHCAALSSPWGRYEDFYRSNVVATENLLKAAEQTGVKRFVHISTPSLYVDGQDRLDVREDQPLPARPINFYAATKRLAEDSVDRAVKNGLSVISIRPAGIIGPGDNAILPRLLRVAKKGILPVIGSGESLVDLTYVDNVVASILLALRAPNHLSGRKYNITNGEPLLLYDTVDRIFGQLGLTYRRKKISFRKAYAIASTLEFTHKTVLRGKEPLLTRYSVCALGRSRTLNIDAAKKDLGYQPPVAIQDALSSVVESLR